MLIVSATLIAVLGASALAPAPTNVVAQIDVLCGAVTQASRNQPPQQIYADFANISDQDAPEDWRPVSSTAELAKVANTTDLYTQAFVWVSGSATLVKMLYNSQSGDSVQYEEQCFDGAGVLVRNVATLNTFSAIDPSSQDGLAVSRIRTSYYASNGKTLRTRTELLDLKTRQPKPHVEYMDQSDTIYRKLSELPFRKLMTQ